jgi:hypothetical protein
MMKLEEANRVRNKWKNAVEKRENRKGRTHLLSETLNKVRIAWFKDFVHRPEF